MKPRGTYAGSRSGDHIGIFDITTAELDSLFSIERLGFSDVSIALDVTGAAGMTAKLLGAVFGAQFVQNRELAGAGLRLFDAGSSYEEVAAAAVSTDLFGTLAGSHSDAAFVEYVFENAVGRAPTQSESSLFTGLLASGTHTQASLAVFAAESTFNQQSIHLVGLQQTGLEFV